MPVPFPNYYLNPQVVGGAHAGGRLSRPHSRVRRADNREGVSSREYPAYHSEGFSDPEVRVLSQSHTLSTRQDHIIILAITIHLSNLTKSLKIS
jgi:hypothetical protein